MDWFTIEEIGSIEASVDFGQTHVIREYEDRWAPPLIEGRAAMFLFHTFSELEEDSDVRISAWKDGELLGVLPLNPPDRLPKAVEQSITDVPLEPWSDEAWSAFLPYSWIEEGVELLTGVDDEGELWTHSFVLTDLGAPQRFTVSRSKMVLFGTPDKETDTETAERIGQDFFSALPVSHMRWVDSAPWRLSEIVVNAEGGPALVTSEGERLDRTTDPDRWNIIKHQFALRMSLANTGRGLTRTWPSEGDSSPYSFGTSVGSGWVMNDDGSYSDLDNAPYAAGWTGWTAIWLGECGNGFIHELGHSGTLAHFTSGTASSWGIADEYPIDGIHVEAHPWGFDTTREQFRTWYRVNSSGPVLDEGGGYVGKNDPMNGGDTPTNSHCYPQYIPYQAWKIQDWSESTPTIKVIDDVPGVYQWNSTSREYDGVDLTGDERQVPIAVDVPVATIVGALGVSPDARRIYTPMYWASGNAFELPDPEADDLHSVYTGAQFFLEIQYGDGSADRALIARPDITDENLYLYSLNIEMEKDPTHIGLWLSPTGYPDIDIEAATLQHEMAVDGTDDEIPEALNIGRGLVPNDALQLNDWCETGVDCDSRYDESSWRFGEGPIHFIEPGRDSSETTVCSEPGEWTDLSIPVINEDEEADEMIVRAQRIVSNGTTERAGPTHDHTPWLDSPTLKQSIRVWIPYEENLHLSAGTWTNHGEYSLEVMHDAEVLDQANIEINLRIYESEAVDLETSFEGPSHTADGSSTYFIVTDSSVGPIGGVWWGNSDPTPLVIPVRDEATGADTVLYANAWKRSCWLGWATWWNLNSAQVADGSCDQWVHLEIGENDHLESRHRYVSPGARPVVIRAMAWHLGTEITRDAYTFSYTAP